MSETLVETAVDTARRLSEVSRSTAPREQFEIDDSGANAATVAEDERQYPTGPKLWAITGSLAVVLVALGFDIAVVAVTIPALSDEWQSIQDIAWYSTALRLVMCSFMFAFGKAYTIFSIKNLFMLSLFTFEVGNIFCTFANSSVMFIVGRAICGFGCAGLSSGVFTVFTHAFPMRKRALVGGYGGALETLACLAAPILGGQLVTHWTWRACFGINIPLGIIGCAGMFWFLKLEPNADEGLPIKEKLKRLDLMGTACFAPAVVCLLLALQWGGAVYAWNNVRVIVLFVLFAVLMTSFFLLQWKLGEKASLPFRILKNRSLLAGSLFAMCTNGTVAVIEYYMSIYFQGVRGETAAKAGIYLIPMIAGMCIGAPLSGAVTTWIGYYFPSMYACTILGAVSVGVLSTVDIDTNLALPLCMLCVLGFAFGIGIQGPQLAAQAILDIKEVSIGLAIVQFGSQIGPVLFLASGTALFTNRLEDEITKNAPNSNISSIENMGLTDIRTSLSGDALKNVLTGYNEALVQTLYLPLAVVCLSIIGCVAIERRSVKKKD